MPYSNKIKSDFITLAREEFEKALSHCKTLQEIDSFCTALYLTLRKEISHGQVKDFLNENKRSLNNLPHDIETMLSNLLELASNEGFELYATEEIIDLVNQEYDGTSSDARSILIPAFTSNRDSQNEKIEEAKNQFIIIIREELYLQLDKAVNLFDEQKLEKIQEQEKNKAQISKNQAEMATRQPPEEGSEAHAESENESLRRLQSEFQHEGNSAQLERIITNIERTYHLNRRDSNNSIAAVTNIQLQIITETIQHSLALIQNQQPRTINNALITERIYQNSAVDIIEHSNNESANTSNRRSQLFPRFFRPHRQAINQINLQENEVENTSSGSSNRYTTL